MTLEEKIGQLQQLSYDDSEAAVYREAVLAARVGSVLNAFEPEGARELQRRAVEHTRLGDLSAPDTLAATAKHFVGYGAAEGGRDYNTTWITEAHTLRSRTCNRSKAGACPPTFVSIRVHLRFHSSGSSPLEAA